MKRADAEEIEWFDRRAGDWWDPKGAMAPLHAMQPVRLDYARDQICAAFGRDPARRKPFEGLRILDIACGGGLLSEPMARLGAQVTGIDAAPAAIAEAKRHGGLAGLEIDYRQTTLEALADSDFEPVDVALALEIVEHVTDRAAFLAAAARLLKPEGVLILSTLNRTAKSWAAAILGAEYVLRWLPVGAHDWRKFPTPEELAAELRAAGLEPVDRTGFVYAPLAREWSASVSDLSVNYAMTAVPAES